MSAADWKPYDVPGLAGLLAEQPTDSGTHAMAWQQAYETLTDQRQRIEAARTALTEAWAATPGSAARSFFDRVDALTQAMSATAETAVSAHGALTGIVTAVDGATTKVDTLHQSWQQNQATIGDVVPTDDWTQPLNDQAHVVMGQADAAIAEHATQLIPPVPYSPRPPTQRYTPIQTAIQRTSIGGTSAAQATATDQMRSAHSRTLTGTGSKAAQSGQAPVDDGGVVLTSSQTGQNAPRQARTLTVPIPSMNPAEPGPGNGTDPLSVSTIVDRSHDVSANLNRGEARNESSDRPASSKSRIGTMRSRTAAIGDTSGVVRTDGAGAVDSRLASTPYPADQTGAATFGGMLPSAGISSGGGSERDRRERNAINWPMPTGVPPVIVAAPEVPIQHDPGPGVIGIDR